MKSFKVSELLKSDVGSRDAQYSELDTKHSQFEIENSHVRLSLSFDSKNKQIRSLTLKSLQPQSAVGSFQEETFTEKLSFYDGFDTHSCVYLFNPN